MKYQTFVDGKPKKINIPIYRQYSKEVLSIALQEIQNGASIRAVAAAHKIPRSSLGRFKQNKSMKTLGRPTTVCTCVC